MNKLDNIVLDNGFTIYFYPDKRRHSTFVQFVTLFGGTTKDFIYDGREYHMPDGVAHILEHYIVECNNHGNFIENLGKREMNTNASTYYRMTRYYFNAVEDIEFGIQTILDAVNNVSFTKEKLEKLKNPIYQEIRGKSDNKFYHSSIMTLNNLFHTISFRSIGGTLKEVESITCQDLEVCYKAFYQPNNQFMVIAGNYDKEKVLSVIKDFYQNRKIEKHEMKLLPIKEEKTVSKKKDTLFFKTPNEYVEFSFKLDVHGLNPCEMLELEFYLGNFFSQFFGIVSPLYKECVEEKIISNTIHSSNSFIDSFIIIQIGAYTHNPKKFKEKVLDTVKKRNSFNEELFEMNKRECILDISLRDESIMSIVMPFVDNIVNYHYYYLDKEEDIKKMNYLDYVKTIQSLDLSNYTILTIKEKES